MTKPSTHFISNIRFNTIKPFLSGEKKLKEIEAESRISYATLKRWVKSYKEKGAVGLERKENKNKSVHKKIDPKGLELIKEDYLLRSSSKISDIYKSTYEKLKTLDCSISYSTFYRIVNTLDSYVQNSSLIHINKIEKKYQVLLAREFFLNSFFWDPLTKKYKLPIVTLIFDSISLELISFSVTFNKNESFTLLASIREGIIKSASKNSSLFPEAVFILSDCRNNFKVDEKIFEQTSIKISQESFQIQEIEKFISLLKNDIKQLYSDISSDSLVECLKDYFSLKEPISSDTNCFSALDIFLPEKTRKIYNNTLRFKNKLYKNIFLEKLIEKNVTIRYNPLDESEIYLYHKKNRISLKYQEEPNQCY